MENKVSEENVTETLRIMKAIRLADNEVESEMIIMDALQSRTDREEELRKENAEWKIIYETKSEVALERRNTIIELASEIESLKARIKELAACSRVS